MLSKKHLCASLLAASALLAVAPSWASNDINWRFSGFGTVGYTATDSDDVLFLNPGQYKGAQTGGTGLVDSRIGGQVNLSFSSKWSATVQAIAKQGPEGKFIPGVEWAFVRYQATDSIAIRAGRLGFPAYQVSDYRYVGYATPWVRAPQEVYKLAPLDHFAGADLSWSHTTGSGYLTVKVLAGQANAQLPDQEDDSAKLKVDQLTGAYLTYEFGNFRLRGGVSTSKVTYNPSGAATLLAGLRLAGLDKAADTLQADDARTTFYSLGGVYNAEHLQVTAEVAKLTSDSDLIGTSTGWYATVGYRINQWTPYITQAGFNKQNDNGDFSIPAVGPLLPLIGAVDFITAGDSQNSTSLGLRYDVNSNLAIKAQMDRIRPASTGGQLSVVNPAFDGHSVNVYTVVADFVF